MVVHERPHNLQNVKTENSGRVEPMPMIKLGSCKCYSDGEGEPGAKIDAQINRIGWRC